MFQYNLWKGVSAYWENSSLYSVSEDTCDGFESSYSVKSNICINVCIYISFKIYYLQNT